MNNSKYIKNCPITGSENFIRYLDLGEMPLVNNLLDSKKKSLECEKYPASLNYFPESGLTSLSYSVDKNILYNYYTYKSGISLPYIEHCKELYDFISTYISLDDKKKIADIGGNDGTLLNTFLSKKPGLNVTNIDASENICSLSKEKSINTINAFWGVDIAKSLGQKYDLIISTNVFQHTFDINDFTEAISISLNEGGIWCLEFPYWKKTLETNQYDQIYHEHFYYYLVSPLSLLLDKFNLCIIKIAERDIHGGTARLLIAHKNDIGRRYQICKSVSEYISHEKMDSDYYLEWGVNVKKYIEECRSFILSLKRNGKKIAGFGAAAKGCIFLNTAGLDHTIIDYVIDDTDLKQGKFIPGTGIEIFSRNHLRENEVDYLIILAHNFSDYIIKSLSSYKGKFIVMYPEIKVI